MTSGSTSQLSERIINYDLLRYLAKLQVDEEPGIRTNTTICLGKIARYLSDAVGCRVGHWACICYMHTILEVLLSIEELKIVEKFLTRHLSLSSITLLDVRRRGKRSSSRPSLGV